VDDTDTEEDIITIYESGTLFLSIVWDSGESCVCFNYNCA
jgi:hypothetical protein